MIVPSRTSKSKTYVTSSRFISPVLSSSFCCLESRLFDLSEPGNNFPLSSPSWFYRLFSRGHCFTSCSSPQTEHLGSCCIVGFACNCFFFSVEFTAPALLFAGESMSRLSINFWLSSSLFNIVSMLIGLSLTSSSCLNCQAQIWSFDATFFSRALPQLSSTNLIIWCNFL